MTNQFSVETKEQALKIAKATQKPKQTKEQTKLIAQGIEKGISEYKKQQKKKSREKDKQRKKEIKQKASKALDTNAEENLKNPPQQQTQWLPWFLLIVSWLVFILFMVFNN